MHRLTLILMLATLARPEIVVDVQQAISQSNLALAESYIKKYRSERGITPELIEALSWLGRGALGSNQLDRAEAYARQTEQLAVAELKKRPLDAEPHLPLALGAAIEVSAQVMNARGERADALA